MPWLGTTAIVLLIAAATLTGCSSNLKRDFAASAISQHQFFKDTLPTFIPKGEFCNAVNRTYPDPATFLAEHQVLRPLGRLRTEGYIEFTARHINSFDVGRMAAETMLGGQPSGRFPEACRRPTGQGFDYYYWTATVTPKGIEAGLPKDGGYVIAAKRAFVGVTGLIENADNSTTAEFDWRWEPTPEGAKLHLAQDPPVPARASAMFRKYDDGWRLVEIKS